MKRVKPQARKQSSWGYLWRQIPGVESNGELNIVVVLILLFSFAGVFDVLITYFLAWIRSWTH